MLNEIDFKRQINNGGFTFPELKHKDMLMVILSTIKSNQISNKLINIHATDIFLTNLALRTQIKDSRHLLKYYE